MGSSEVICYFPQNDGAEESALLSEADILRKFCPHYLAMGMSADEYWHGDAELCRYYREAYAMKRQAANEDAWMHGFYVYSALKKASPLFRDWVKDHSPEMYFEKPIPFFEQSEEVRKQEEMKQDLDVQDTLRSWIHKFNKNKKEDTPNG